MTTRRRRRRGGRRHVRHTQKRGVQSGDRRRFWRRHDPGADEVPSDGGSGQEQKQNERSHTGICREAGEPFTSRVRNVVGALPLRRFGSRAHRAFDVLLFRLLGYAQVKFELEAKPEFG